MRLYIPSGLNSKPFASQGREPLIIHFWLLVALEISMTTQIIIEASISICDYFFWSFSIEIAVLCVYYDLYGFPAYLSIFSI